MLPARRSSKSMKRSRRAHHALKPVNLTSCPKCQAAKLPHAACDNCGFVSRKISLKMKTAEET